MEAAPHGLFVRQCKQMSVLAQTLAQVVRDQPGGKELCSCAYEIQRDADALSLAKGIEVPAADRSQAVPPLAPQATNSTRQRPQSAGPRGGAVACNNDAGSLGTVRVGDFRQDLDALCVQMRRARADLDALSCGSRRHDELATQSIAEIKRLRSDLKDMQEALVTHDNEIQQVTATSKAAARKIDAETEAWRAATVHDAAELRQMLKGVSDDVDAEFQRLHQAIDAGLSENRQLVNKFRAELQAEMSGVAATTTQETTECIKQYGLEQERHLSCVDARFSEQLTENLSKYGEGLRVEIRELRGRVEAELTSCRQDQSLMSQRLSNNLEDVSRTSRRAVEEVAEVQKSVSQLGAELSVVQRGVDDVRNTAVQATEGLRAQFDMRFKESQQVANDCGMQQIEQQAETMASIITRVVSEVRVEFETTTALLSARLEESNAEQLASSQSLAAAQEELERQLRDCAVVVGQHADEANNRVGAKLEELEGRSFSRMDELKTWMVSQLAKIEQTACELSEAQLATLGQNSITTGNLKEDIDHKLAEVRNMVSDAQRDLSSNVRSLGHELASSRKANDTRFSQLVDDLNDVRQRFDSPEDFNATRAKEAAERVESAAKQSATEIAATLRSMREQVRTDHEALGVELRGLLSHSDQRFRLGLDAVQSRVDEVQNAARRNQTDASTELQRLQGGLSEAERNLSSLLSSIDEIKVCTEIAARGSANQSSVEKAHADQLRQLRTAGDILATGILRIAQVIGVLPGLDHVDETRLHGSSLNLTELLRWESEGNPLVKRIESAWQPRALAQGGTVLDALQRKAEQSTLRLVQSALRDLDVRVSHMRTGGSLESLGPPPWLGKTASFETHTGEKAVPERPQSARPQSARAGIGGRKPPDTETEDLKPQFIAWPPSAPLSNPAI